MYTGFFLALQGRGASSNCSSMKWQFYVAHNDNNVLLQANGLSLFCQHASVIHKSKCNESLLAGELGPKEASSSLASKHTDTHECVNNCDYDTEHK